MGPAFAENDYGHLHIPCHEERRQTVFENKWY